MYNASFISQATTLTATYFGSWLLCGRELKAFTCPPNSSDPNIIKYLWYDTTAALSWKYKAVLDTWEGGFIYYYQADDLTIMHDFYIFFSLHLNKWQNKSFDSGKLSSLRKEMSTARNKKLLPTSMKVLSTGVKLSTIL